MKIIYCKCCNTVCGKLVKGSEWKKGATGLCKECNDKDSTTRSIGKLTNSLGKKSNDFGDIFKDILGTNNK